MADRKLAPRDKRVLVRFLQRSKAEAEAAAEAAAAAAAQAQEGSPNAADGESDAKDTAAEAAVTAAEAQAVLEKYKGRPFVDVLEAEYKLSKDLHRLVTNAMTWSAADETVRCWRGQCESYVMLTGGRMEGFDHPPPHATCTRRPRGWKRCAPSWTRSACTARRHSSPPCTAPASCARRFAGQSEHTVGRRGEGMGERRRERW